MLLQKRPSANDSHNFSLGGTVWSSAQGRGNAVCSSGWLILGWSPAQTLPASSAPAGSRVREDAQQASSDHLLRGERLMCCSKLQDFMASLGSGYQFQGPSKGKWKMHQFHVDSGQKINFPTLSLEEWNASVRKNSPVAASLEMGVQLSKDFTILRPEGSCWSPPFLILLFNPKEQTSF